MIEKNIFQIYHNKELIPCYVKKHLLNLNPSYNYNFYDFNEGKKIVMNNFELPFAKKICRK